ncbi:hypothetical protein [Neisseria gonorrhoeae]
MAEEMRTCKACGGTKPLEKGFNAVPRKEGGVYYYKSCKTCRNKAVRQKRAEKRAAAGAGAMTAARLHGYIRAAHAACPILRPACGRNRQGNARDTPYPALPRIGKPILADLAQQGGQERGGGGV